MDEMDEIYWLAEKALSIASVPFEQSSISRVQLRYPYETLYIYIYIALYIYIYNSRIDVT